MPRFMKSIEQQVRKLSNNRDGIIVRAIKIEGTNPELKQIWNFLVDQVGEFNPRNGESPIKGVAIDPLSGHYLLATPYGIMTAAFGDWVLESGSGAWIPCTATHVEEGWTEVITHARLVDVGIVSFANGE